MKVLFQWIVAGGLLAGMAQQLSQPPKPGPGHRKLQLWTGEWTYEGENYTSFLGPAGKFTGKETAHPIMDGFGLESVFVERGPTGETRYVEIDGCDPAAKNYPYIMIYNNGDLSQGAFTVTGTVAKWEGISVMEGKPFHDRGTDTVSPDGMSYSKSGEVSQDGKTWVPWFTLHATKVKPAPAGKAK